MGAASLRWQRRIPDVGAVAVVLWTMGEVVGALVEEFPVAASQQEDIVYSRFGVLNIAPEGLPYSQTLRTSLLELVSIALRP